MDFFLAVTMSPYLTVTLLLGALCTVQAYNGRGWWLQQPYEEDSEFTLKAEYGKDYILNCTGDFTVDFWVIPDMNIIDEMVNPSQKYFRIDGDSFTQWYGKWDKGPTSVTNMRIGQNLYVSSL
jgi:hypothetical protein